MSLLDDNSAAVAAGATVEVVTNLAELEAMRDEWRELARRSAGATPFQSPDWLLPWCRYLGGGALRVVALRAADRRLVALAPLIVDANPWRGGERTAWLLGTGVSDYGGVLVEAGWEGELREALREDFDARDDVAWVDLQQLRADSPLLEKSTAWRKNGAMTGQEPCPVVRLAGERRAWLPTNWRKKIEYERRRLERTAAAEFVRADEGNLAELFATLVRLHGARWADNGGGVVAEERVQAFHAEVARGMQASGALRLYALRANSAMVACYYGFKWGARAFYYLGGFDPAWEKFGVGNLVVDHAMTEAAGEGAEVFDFLRGREPYKYRWGAQDEPTFRLEVKLHHA